MGLTDFIGTIWMGVMSLMCALLAGYGHKKRYDVIQGLKRRPSRKYIKQRLLAMKIFNEMFPDIQQLAKKTSDGGGKDIKKDCKDKTAADVLELTNLGFRSTIASILGEDVDQNRVDDLLREKINHLYESLMIADENKSMMHKAIRFEIKKRCMKNPYDILGSQLSKKIENILQDTIEMKVWKPPSSSFSLCFLRLNSLGIIQALKSKMQMIGSITNHPKEWLAIRVAVGMLVFVAAVNVLVRYNLWLEMGLILVLMLFDLGIIVFMKGWSFPSKFRTSSIVKCVSKAIFLTGGLYLYDHASDMEVLRHYMTPKSCNGSLISSTFFPVYSINGHIKELLGADTTLFASEIHTPVVVLVVVFITAGISTVSSLHCIKKQIFVTLAIEGELKDATAEIEVESYRFLEKNSSKTTEESLSLWHVLKRNEISITEGGMESLYQFMIQWGLYFTLDYWLSLADVTQQFINLNTNQTSNATHSILQGDNGGNSTILNRLSSDDICGIREGVSFEFIWKSGVISLLSISLAQLKLNFLQHELSLDVTQKILYFLACISNTATYATLMVLFGTNLFDYIPLSRDTLPYDDDITGFLLNHDTSQVEFWAIYVLLLSPMILRFTTWIGWLLPKLCCGINILPQENVDKLDEVHERMDFETWATSIRSILRTSMLQISGGAGLGYPQFLQLPTSQALQTRFPYYFDCVSYNFRESPQLLAAFVNQCTLFTLALFMNALFMASNIYLLSVNENFERLRDEIDLSPSEISGSRKNFVAFSCVVIPLGFVLEYVFLYLYFKFDRGFFTVAKLQFVYTKNKSVGRNQVTGYWIDLSCQDRSPHDDPADGEPLDECNEEAFMNSLELDETEKILFEDIKESIPYYYINTMENVPNHEGNVTKFEYKTLPMIGMMCLTMYVILNNFLDYGNKLQPSN